MTWVLIAAGLLNVAALLAKLDQRLAASSCLALRIARGVVVTLAVAAVVGVVFFMSLWFGGQLMR